MKKILAACSGFLLLALPVLASADDVQVRIKQLLTIVASLQAQEAALGGQNVACAALPSKEKVRVNEPFVLAWGSVGAMSPGDDPAHTAMWQPNDASVVALSQPGLWSYSFKFYGKSGGEATCIAKIEVTS